MAGLRMNTIMRMTMMLIFAHGLFLAAQRSNAHCARSGRALFVFGDSLVDSGNNNYLVTSARADRKPYGIDFPGQVPTGRFSNGLNIPDLIAEMIGTQAPLPYLHPFMAGEKLFCGANFASAGIGILNDTGFQFVSIIRIQQQLQNFRTYQNRVAGIIGGPAAQDLIARSLLSITLGGNDYVNNYYLTPFSLRSRQYTLPDYTRYIVSEYEKILAQLYDLGGRRLMVTALGPMGCAPASRATRSGNGECDPALQRAAILFNGQLRSTVVRLNQRYGEYVFTLANSFAMNMDLINNPQRYGFRTSNTACCGQGRFNGIGLCTGLSSLCTRREDYLYWDNYHPGEKACRIIVSRFMNGDSDVMYPINLTSMLLLNF